MQEALDGSYVEVEADRQTRTGITGKNTAATAKNYAGFIKSGDVDQVPIAADGSTVIEIRYNRKDITLTFHLAGGAIEGKSASITVIGKYGAPVEKKFADPSKVGYTFSVWNPVLPETFPTEDSVYTAQWAKEGEYRLAYKLNGGRNNGSNPASYNPETEIPLNNATRTGYTFAGWFDNEACEGEAVTQIAQGSTGDKTFWAKWEANSYTVRFDADGGLPVPQPQSVSYDNKANEPPVPAKEGYDFEGWYNKDRDTRWNFTANAVTTDIELYAKWQIKTYDITFNVDGGNGQLKAYLKHDGSEIISGRGIGCGKTVLFEAKPDAKFEVDTWTITGGELITGTGTDGSRTAKVKITAETTVKVTFKHVYVQVAFDYLNIYLTQIASASEINYIEVTGIQAGQLKGDGSSSTNKSSALGYILKSNPARRVALKLDDIIGLTDMSYCFYECQSLVQVLEIPNGVQNMSYCFCGCKSLEQTPEIPDSVQNMSCCFIGCENLINAPKIPSSVQNMSYCFESCKSLRNTPVISDNVTDMSFCFRSCASLRNVSVLGDSVEDMQGCFNGCFSLMNVPKIPNSVKNMQNCFRDCTSLRDAPVLGDSVEDMQGCFSGCTSLMNVPEIPSSVTTMTACFNNCTSLTSVTLKCNYQSSFNNAFAGCRSLKAGSIKVPKNQLSTYTSHSSSMGAQSNWFVADE